jgi:hypothetical protein
MPCMKLYLYFINCSRYGAAFALSWVLVLLTIQICPIIFRDLQLDRQGYIRTSVIGVIWKKTDLPRKML